MRRQNIPSLDSLLAASLSRRELLKAGAAGAVLALSGCATTREAPSGPPGFASVPISTEDRLLLPPGYRAQVLYAWGDAVGSESGSPAFRWDGSNSAAEQALQAGMHHDAIEYFPLPQWGAGGSDRALLAINHEYVDHGMLFADGEAGWSAEKVRKSQAAHGVAIVEVERAGAEWRVVRPSKYARRITAYTPMTIAGPAAGHASLVTAADPTGRLALGTFNNCAAGYTPWGTYLTCEENFNMYFANAGTAPAGQQRYGIGGKSAYRWEEHDGRFDAAAHPNEPNRFGWVVEIDPYDPQSRPVKRTALGRIKHEGAMSTLAADGRVVVYMGDDEVFECVYKFVSARLWNPRDRAANATLLDEGRLYVARFDEGGAGRWIELAHGRNGLVAAAGFASQADVLVKTRQAAQAVGATRMDRPEWAAVHPVTQEVYLTLTNNTRRGTKKQPGADAANPRSVNTYGHIVRWREDGGDPAAEGFRWSHFVLAGDTQAGDPLMRGTVKGDSFGSPDGLWFDKRGMLWIQTDVAAGDLGRPAYARIGNNQMLAADVASGEIRRFLVGPRTCEITGCTMSPDGRSMFINVQHPGESRTLRHTDPAKVRAESNWPDFRADGRPRSATVVIRREDGGLIGA